MQQHCPLYPCRLQKSHCLYPTSRPTSKKPVGMQPYCCGLLMSPIPCETGRGHLSEVVISTLLTGTWAWQHCQLYIACPCAGGQSSCSSAPKHSLSKEQAPSACWATGCEAPPSCPYPTSPVRPQQPEEWAGTPRGLPCP